MTEGRPSADAVERRTLSPSVRVIWGLRAVAGVAVLTAVATIAVTVTTNVQPWIPALLGVLVLLVAVGWVERRYRVWAFEVRPDALYLERGVVTHVRTIAPYVRIQHVDTQRGPLERWLGLSTLVVYTAGSRGADVAIPGLTPDEASDLQARVKQLAIEAEGGDAV
jgi:membrane protein YdbS with pleckstrin-like domain